MEIDVHERVINRHDVDTAGVLEEGRVHVARDVGVGARGAFAKIRYP